MYIDKLSIVVREHHQVKGSPPSKNVVARLKFDGYINHEAVEKLLDLLSEEVYKHDAVSINTDFTGTNW